MSKHDDDYADPELREIDELGEIERLRDATGRHVRSRSAAVILVAIIVLVALGFGSALIAAIY